MALTTRRQQTRASWLSASAQAFWEVVTNPVAVSKFFHSVTSGWVTGGVFVVAVSGWYLLKGREKEFARKSMLIGAIVGLVGTGAVMLSGDSSGVHAAKYQPMKLAAAEGLENGGPRAPFSIVPGVEVPGMLSILATHDIDGVVPGINDILNGYTDNEGNVIPSVAEVGRQPWTIRNSSSSYFTLKVMFWVSLLIPFVVAYIAYAWRAMDKHKITREEIEKTRHRY